MNLKKISALVMALFVLLTPFAACQPTPDAPIVNAGDDSVLNEKIDATAIPLPEGKDENIASIYGFPSSYKDEFTGVDTAVNFYIDANVSVPDVQSVPVVEAAPTNIPKEMVKTFTEKMLPGITFFDRKEILTKADCENYISLLQDSANMPFDLFCKTYYSDDPEMTEEEMRKQYDIITYSYEKYKEMLPTAPETVVQQPFDFEYHDLAGYYLCTWPEFEAMNKYENLTDAVNDGRKFMWMSATLEDGSDIYDVAMEVTTYYRDEKNDTFEYYVGYPPTPEYHDPAIESTEARDLTLNRQELRELGEKTLECMGLSDVMVLTEAMYGKKRCELHYHRGFNGLAASDVTIENDYAYVNGNESLKILIQNDMVTSIYYENPYEITKVENENVELISFEDAYSAFKKQAALEFTAGYSVGGSGDGSGASETARMKSYNISIKEIEFVMVRIPIRNGQYRYVPAWQFRGSAELTFKDGHTQTADDLTFMTINAVDGTRIAGLED